MTEFAKADIVGLAEQFSRDGGGDWIVLFHFLYQLAYRIVELEDKVAELEK